MLVIKNNDYHTRFEKHILTDGRCQLVIIQTESLKWLLDRTFNTETEADEFLTNHWKRYCRISEEIYYAGVCAMLRAYQDFKEGYLY
jgi:hypothetical protein